MPATMSADDGSPSPPPWEVLLLVARHLDPKTMAVASCVCRTWSHSISLDFLWKPPCAAHFPSLCSPYAVTESHEAAVLSFRHLYALGQQASRRCRPLPPAKPCLCLSDVLFLINMQCTKQDLDITTLFAPASKFRLKAEVFRVDLSIGGERLLLAKEELGDMQVTWNAVLKGWKGVFTMLTCAEKTIGIEPFMDKWFTQDLAPPACCSSICTTSLAAEVKLGFGEKTRRREEMRMESVSVGILSLARWRYLSVDDGLRYLQNFLLS